MASQHGSPQLTPAACFHGAGRGRQLRSRALTSRLRPAIRHKSKVHDQDIHTVIISEETMLPRFGTT